MDKMMCQEYLTQGQTLMSQGKYETALSFLAKAEQEDKLNIEVYLTQGVALANLDRLDEAKEVFEKALKVDRKSGIAYFHLGNIEMLQGDRGRGIEMYNAAVANGFDDAQVFFTIGLTYEEDGNDELALRNYNKAIHKDPLRPDARIRKIRIMIRNGRPEETLKAIDELILACPDVFEGYHLRFTLLLEMGKLPEAEKTIDSAIAMFPKDTGFALDKATLMTAKGQYEQALAYLDDIEANMAVDTTVQHNMAMQKARIAANQADMDRTIQYLECAKQVSMAVDPTNVDREAEYLLMNCYISSEQFDKALDCTRALKNKDNPDHFALSAYYYEPFILMRQGKEAEAKPLYQQAISDLRAISLQNPGYIDSYVFRILCLKDLKQYDKAIELADYLVAIQEELAEAHMIRAIVLKEMGREAEAQEEKERAKSLGGMMSEALESLQM